MELKETIHTFYVVYDWMNYLGLTSNQRDVYAVIFGYTVSKKKSFRGSQTYLGERTLSSRITVNRSIKVLKEKGLIRVHEFEVNNVTYYDYRAIECALVQEAKEKERQKKSQKQAVFDTDLMDDDTTPCKLEIQPVINDDTTLCIDSEHNNKAEIKEEKKAVSFEKKECGVEKASEPASLFKIKIKDLFKTESYPFDSRFEDCVNKELRESGVGEEKAEAFLDFVMERVKANANCSSPVGLFRKLALSADVVIDFNQTYKAPAKPAKEECPCCGEKTAIGNETCEHCGLGLTYFKDELEIHRHKEKMKLAPNAREKLEEEIMSAIVEGGFMSLDPATRKKRDLKIEQIYRNYGINFEIKALA